MQWQDVNLETAEWRYLVTKTKVQHIVPLSRQAVAILKELHPLTPATAAMRSRLNERRPASAA